MAAGAQTIGASATTSTRNPGLTRKEASAFMAAGDRVGRCSGGDRFVLMAEICPTAGLVFTSAVRPTRAVQRSAAIPAASPAGRPTMAHRFIGILVAADARRL